MIVVKPPGDFSSHEVRPGDETTLCGLAVDEDTWTTINGRADCRACARVRSRQEENE